jgi:general stress protein 26
MKGTRKVGEIRKNPGVALSIWSCRDFSDPYVVIQAKGTVHEDLATKKKYWDPMKVGYFQTPENPEYVILQFVPRRIEYYAGMALQVWER